MESCPVPDRLSILCSWKTGRAEKELPGKAKHMGPLHVPEFPTLHTHDCPETHSADHTGLNSGIHLSLAPKEWD